MAETIDYALADRVATVTLNRPEYLNAISPTLLRELVEALETAEADPAAHVVVLAGAGRSFCAGMDLKGANAGGGGITADRDFLERVTRSFLRIWDLRMPVIAKVHGHCLAAGTQLASISDVTFVSAECKVGTPQLPLGAGFVGTYWAWLVGPKKAKEMFFPVGSMITGAEAVEMGLFNRAVPGGELDSAVAEYAAWCARTPKEILALQKQAINRVQEIQGFREALMQGIEIDALAHFSKPVRAINRHIRDHGLQETLAAWKRGDDIASG